MLDWIQNQGAAIWWIGSFSTLVFLGFLVGVPVIIVKLPPGYFLKYAAAKKKNNGFSARRLLYLIFRNLFGAAMVLAGIAMLFLPGQGILGIIIGISLLSFSGKRKLVLKIVRQKHVLSSMNRLRAKFNKPAFQLPQ